MKIQSIKDLEAEMRAVARGEKTASPDVALPSAEGGHSENAEEFKSNARVERRGAVTESVRASARLRETAEPSAARSQDFLYGDDGLPQ